MRIPFTRKRATKCGHLTRRKDREQVSPFSDPVVVHALCRKDGTMEYCTACVAAMTIRCAWCRRFIYPPMPVTLYTPAQPDITIPAGAVVYNTEPLQVVGCGRDDCADTGADYAGFWIPDEHGCGHVRRFTAMLDEAAQTRQGGVLYNPVDGTYEESLGR